MNIKPDELLHSYYLRTCAVNGGIISKSYAHLMAERSVFSWRNHSSFYLPELLNCEPEDIYNDVEVLLKRHTLLSLYLPTLPLTLYARMIESHLIPISQRNSKINRVLNDSIPSRYTLNFCNICLVEQIQTYGFHWYKLEWSFADVNTCSIHDKPLKTLRCNSCGYKYDKLSNMMQGLQKVACSFCNSSMLKNSSFEDIT